MAAEFLSIDSNNWKPTWAFRCPTTQWEMAEEGAELIKPARDELIRQAARGEVLHNDDTGMRVLKLEREPSDKRTGTFTSGIVSTNGQRRIALYFTGRNTPGRIWPTY